MCGRDFNIGSLPFSKQLRRGTRGLVLITVTGANTCRGLCQTSASHEAGLFSSVPLRQVKPSEKAIVSKLEERTLRTTALQSHRASKQKLCLDSRQCSPSLGASPFFLTCWKEQRGCGPTAGFRLRTCRVSAGWF